MVESTPESMKSNRRIFLKEALLLGLGASCSGLTFPSTASGFFEVAQKNNRWWLIDPSGNPFWSIGINHVDSAPLRDERSNNIWEEKYHNSMEQWLGHVKQDLESWGFNTLGWNQEVVTINDQNHRHSRSFTFEEYQWLDMPYCHLLPFIDSHQWEVETRLPDIESKGFAEWCEYVARDQCSRMKDDPKLIGYFYTDCPTFVHSRPGNVWRGSLMDPELLNTESGRKEIKRKASVYYKVIHDAIRRFDKNHLILGDRYEARAALPTEIIDAAIPYVDVLSFQCFGGAEIIQEKIGFWANYANRPVLLADSAMYQKPFEAGWPPKSVRHQSPEAYKAIQEVLQGIEECIGFHLCGAYIANDARKYGLKDSNDQIDSPFTEGIQAQNLEMQKWVDEKSK